jgi:hypothetical protein
MNLLIRAGAGNARPGGKGFEAGWKEKGFLEVRPQMPLMYLDPKKYIILSPGIREKRDKIHMVRVLISFLR